MSTKRFPLLLLFLMILSACGDVSSPALIAAGDVPPSATFLSSGLAKPISDLREYNGTTYGSPGTGSIGYSVLYRDNYDTPSSGVTFTDEGSGRHAGVDIGVISGTAVYATQAGVVEYNGCDSDGWGGLVVIKSPNLYGSGYVYHSYAHMRSRFGKTKPASVAAGEVLGQSGGAQGDTCTGNTQGAHLHYQIDNDLDNLWPHAQVAATNTPDATFSVNQHTYNPMVYIQGGYRWEFQQNGNREYWQATNVASSGVSGGAFWLDGNNDPWVQRGDGTVACGLPWPCSTQIAAEASFYKYVRLDMALNCTALPIAIYFKTSGENFFSGDKVVTGQPYGPLPAVTTYNMGAHPKWTGIITGLRVDPGTDCSGNSAINYIGYIRLVSSSTG